MAQRVARHHQPFPASGLMLPQLAVRALRVVPQVDIVVPSVEAGVRAATVLTIISTAVRNDLDVWAYLNDVLEQRAREDVFRLKRIKKKLEARQA